ncbi:unnamed protein product [Cercospora beticola]|nr:unnamed protein product [Cercospora beticola]
MGMASRQASMALSRRRSRCSTTSSGVERSRDPQRAQHLRMSFSRQQCSALAECSQMYQEMVLILIHSVLAMTKGTVHLVLLEGARSQARHYFCNGVKDACFSA